MLHKLQVTPGKLSRSMAGFTAVIAVLFLVFGVVLVLGTDDSTSDSGLQTAKMAFMAIWIAVCIGIIAFNLRVFITPRDPAAVSLFQVEEDAGEERGAALDGAFDVRLRKLEALRREELITEGEYRRKRAELLDEKW
jgi:hypothetical protein